MASQDDIKVWVVTDRNPYKFPCSNDFTAEKLCVDLCKQLRIPPLTRTLFALRIKGTEYYLKDDHELRLPEEYELRIRFQVPTIARLSSLETALVGTTIDYLFRQVRNDVNNDKIPEVDYVKHKKELLGLGITEMYRAVLEEGLSLSYVEKNYRNYIPKVIVKNHGRYAKKHAQAVLTKLSAANAISDVNFVKIQYLQHLEQIAPNYLSEEYRELTWCDGDKSVQVHIQVAPFHPESGLRLYNAQKGEWSRIGTIEDIVYLNRREDSNFLDISRNGQPLLVLFKSKEQLFSFISVCDGYYRLMVKWTYNLSIRDQTPSLSVLHKLKCHGPVGGAFSYNKLKEKSNNRHGAYILRQSEDDYDVYYLDVCNKNGSPYTYKVEHQPPYFTFNNVKYESIAEIINKYKDPESDIYLKFCIPPSEYDKSDILWCMNNEKQNYKIEQNDLQHYLKENKSPRCLSVKDIMLFEGAEKLDSEGIMITHKALWILDEKNKVVVAFKTIHKNKANFYLKDFIQLASKWTCVQSNAIVKFYGITLTSPTAMVLEYMPYGSFDSYLRTNKNNLDISKLKEVVMSLASALFTLSEAGIVHGFIRCRRLLLAVQDKDRIVCKLSGSSLRSYRDDDLPWIPIEFHSDKNLAKQSVDADIWAFGTTLWEIFSYGDSPLATKAKMAPEECEYPLPRPSSCPAEIWSLILECWQTDPHTRTRPQEILRYLNYVLAPEYSTSAPRYEKMDLNMDRIEVGDISLDSFGRTITSNNTGYTSSYSVVSDSTKSTVVIDSPLDNILERNKIKEITSRGKKYNLIFGKEIGSGHYGRVYKSEIESTEGNVIEKKVVAAKCLERKRTAREDFTNELHIMEGLVHPNIVEILGNWETSDEVGIVMEYIEERSLNDYLKYKGDKLNNADLLKYALDIAMGMDYISSKDIVHRDLAARNILVVNKNHVKISDFGLARLIPKTEHAYKLKSDRGLPIAWYAPESACLPYLFSKKSDVWSYGVTVWEIFTRLKVPDFDTVNYKKRAESFVIPNHVPEMVSRYLMRDCWNITPTLRPDFIHLVHKCKEILNSIHI